MRQSLLKHYVRQALKAGARTYTEVLASVKAARIHAAPRAVRYVLDSMLKHDEATQAGGALAFAG